MLILAALCPVTISTAARLLIGMMISPLACNASHILMNMTTLEIQEFGVVLQKVTKSAFLYLVYTNRKYYIWLVRILVCFGESCKATSKAMASDKRGCCIICFFLLKGIMEMNLDLVILSEHNRESDFPIWNWFPNLVSQFGIGLEKGMSSNLLEWGIAIHFVACSANSAC